MINVLAETAQSAEVQETSFAIDVLGRYICSTWDEATSNDGLPFDAIVIGAGMFGGYCAKKTDSVPISAYSCSTQAVCWSPSTRRTWPASA